MKEELKDRLATGSGISQRDTPSDEDFALYEDAIRYFGQGNLAAATQSLEEHVTQHPAHASAYSLLGNLHRMAGRFRDAEDAWLRYLQLKPANRHGLLEIGRCRLAAGDRDGASAMFERYLADEGETPEALYEVGIAYHQNTDHDPAAGFFERALALKPDFHLARQHLAASCHARGEFKLAEKLFRDVVRAQPSNFEVYRHLGAIHRDHGELTTAMADFRHAMQLERRAGKPDQTHDEGYGLTPRHTGLVNLEVYAEQIDYLIGANKLPESYTEELDRYRAVISELKDSAETRSTVTLSENQRRRLGRSFGRILHLGPLAAIPAGTLNHRVDADALRESFDRQDLPVAVVDEFLSEQAVQQLTAYCLESMIWFRPAENGLIRATLEDGFSSSLMLQLVEELRTRFPDVLGTCHLTGLEGRIFASHAYDLMTDDGDSSITLIVWLSPDEANMEPGRGGLQVQLRRDRPTASEADAADEDDFSAPAPQVVAHRFNRAVFIEGSVSYRPDDCRFRPGLRSRRLEILLRFARHRSG